ncbi:MAG: hypothetical protein A3H96_15685 [Acidobacteria bacterium RIFCSPLOWO2_02_FULL_67_36]|nr:MAG: hypothetical protein A3H96_15685 [Acidobacteria bacterium RIFCSPLOWO2_02_FULL_67_36]OFW19448.1 MAG: hypothetical protein A3G21_15855 [Acidobacteria bacterium RIFCSPLOWO2_12_FULL_66_21]
MRPRMKRVIFIAPLAILGILLFGFIGGEIVKLLWNWLLPPIFGWREVTFWQALGMLALCRILFGGLGRGGGTRSNVRRRVADRLADRIGDRWDGMTPEERDRFRQRIGERCGFDPSTANSKEQ